MSEFPSQANIAGRVNAGIGGLQTIVYQNAFTWIILDAHSLQVEPLDIRRTASSGQNFIHDERLLFSLCLVIHEFSAGAALDTIDLRVEVQRDPLTDEG